MSNFFLDLLFPKRCVSCGSFGQYICKTCFKKIQFVEEQICPVCQKASIEGATHPVCHNKYSLDGLLSAVYFSGPVRAAIRKFKYKMISDLRDELIDLLLRNKELVTPLASFKKQGFIIVPVPLHKKRENWRGFNQAKVLGKIIARKLNFAYSEKILQRIENTAPQVDLTKEERLRNVTQAFRVFQKDEVLGKNFLLIDDVATTGATLKSCALALKKAGASSVWALTLARQTSKSTNK